MSNAQQDSGSLSDEVYRRISERFDHFLREEMARPDNIESLDDLTRAIAGPIMHSPSPSKDV